MLIHVVLIPQQNAGEVYTRCWGNSAFIRCLNFQVQPVCDTFSYYAGQAFSTGSQSGVSSGLSFSQAKSQNFDPFADLATLGTSLPGKTLLLRYYI